MRFICVHIVPRPSLGGMHRSNRWDVVEASCGVVAATGVGRVTESSQWAAEAQANFAACAILRLCAPTLRHVIWKNIEQQRERSYGWCFADKASIRGTGGHQQPRFVKAFSLSVVSTNHTGYTCSSHQGAGVNETTISPHFCCQCTTI